MKFKLQPYNLQELGQRQNQEDSLFPGIGEQTTSDRLFILCDGMGGHEKGEVASATVCETMSNTILSRWNPDEPLGDELLQQALEDAYDALDAKDNGEEKKMGTTMTFLCFHSDGVTVAHIGDSRVYQIRPAVGGMPAQIVFKTQDHSLVNELLKIGEITEEEAKNHPQKNVITRAMQPCQERRARATIKHLTDVCEGDYFYMCSDGMLEQTTDENLVNIVTKSNMTDDEKIEILRSVTEENKDNHTAHLIYISSVEGKSAVISQPAGKAGDVPAGTKPQQPSSIKGKMVPMLSKLKNIPLVPVVVGVFAALVVVSVVYLMLPNSGEGYVAPTGEGISVTDTLGEDSMSVRQRAPERNGNEKKDEKKDENKDAVTTPAAETATDAANANPATAAPAPETKGGGNNQDEPQPMSGEL